MARPIIAWLTDFGSTDHYVGAMKGVALGICREAILVDITHDIAPQDIQAAAFELAACYRYFPPATIFVVVVDPGVGSSRRAIAAAAGESIFVAPDNGVLSLVFADCPPRRIVAITNPRYALPVVSRTFEGRDRFAPAAAWLASGVELEALGPVVDAAAIVSVTAPRCRAVGSGVAGEVIRVDRFGNLVTSIAETSLAPLGAPGDLEVGAGRHAHIPLVGTYADVGDGAPCALVGSSGYLEIAVRGGAAARVLALGTGTPVHVSRRA